MAQGPMKATNKIVCETVLIPTITIPTNSYYTEIVNYRPQNYLDALNAGKIGWTEIWSISRIVPGGVISIQANGGYLYGAGGTTITNLRLMYFYEK